MIVTRVTAILFFVLKKGLAKLTRVPTKKRPTWMTVMTAVSNFMKITLASELSNPSMLMYCC
jgi:hypothetical protein